MPDETIVAVYDTSAHADAAVADLRAAQIPESAISRHTGTQATGAATTPPPREQGFWATLFGGDTASDAGVYDRSMDTGSSIVIVKAPAQSVDQVMQLLERHSPIDIDERASSYGLSGTASVGAQMSAASLTAAPATAAPATGTMATDGGPLQLAEERLSVGKRVVNRGGTRIRRYVVETPVEEQVTLHSEKVMLDRHPVTDGRALKDANFTEKTIEMTEMAEEAVVSKTARVVEEVSLRKEATDRVETIRDTVRKEEVEIEQIPATTTTTTTTTTGTTPLPLTPKT